MGRSMYLNSVPSSKKGSVLVLEQDQTLRDGLYGLLTTAGYSLAEPAGGLARDGRIAMILAGIGAQYTPKAALELLDCAAPVILLVDCKAWTGFDFFDAANELGAIAVLQRPFPRSALLRLIADVLSLSDPGRAAASHRRTPGVADLMPWSDHQNLV
jgi:hypothetical protein